MLLKSLSLFENISTEWEKEWKKIIDLPVPAEKNKEYLALLCTILNDKTRYSDYKKNTVYVPTEDTRTYKQTRFIVSLSSTIKKDEGIEVDSLGRYELVYGFEEALGIVFPDELVQVPTDIKQLFQAIYYYQHH